MLVLPRCLGRGLSSKHKEGPFEQELILLTAGAITKNSDEH